MGNFTKKMVFGLVLFLSTSAVAGFLIELKGGAPVNVNLPMYYWLEENEIVTRVSGRYYTDPFLEAPYYAIRLGWVQESQNRWELELIHHKVIMENPPADFNYLNISHGYNFVLINRAWKEKHFTWRVGGGIILAHPEIERANGKKIPFEEGTLVGFYVSGFGMQTSIEKRFFLFKNFYASPEIKLTFGIAQVDIYRGWVNLPNIALHFTVGFGWEFSRKAPVVYKAKAEVPAKMEQAVVPEKKEKTGAPEKKKPAVVPQS